MKYILLLLLLIFMVYSFGILKERKVSGMLLLMLSIFSVVLLLNVEYLIAVAAFLGVGRGADLLLYISFSFGLILWMALHSVIRRQDIVITKLIRRLAILEAQIQND